MDDLRSVRALVFSLRCGSRGATAQLWLSTVDSREASAPELLLFGPKDKTRARRGKNHDEDEDDFDVDDDDDGEDGAPRPSRYTLGPPLHQSSSPPAAQVPFQCQEVQGRAQPAGRSGCGTNR